METATRTVVRNETISRIETLLHANGFEGEIQFRANPDLHYNDVTLDWGAGQAQRSTAALWKEIETLLATMPIERLRLPEQVPPPAPAEPTITSRTRTLLEPTTDTTTTPPTV